MGGNSIIEGGVCDAGEFGHCGRYSSFYLSRSTRPLLRVQVSTLAQPSPAPSMEMEPKTQMTMKITLFSG